VAIAALTSAGALVFTLPVTAQADPPAPTTAAPAPPPLQPNAAPAPLADPNAPPAPAADPNAPPAPLADPNAPTADPNAPPPPPPLEPGRVTNPAGGLSFVVPPGWANADASRLTYGSALLVKAAPPGATAPPATDTSILLGKLDLKLFAGAEPDDTKAAIRLASDMGEFFMPYPGTRINQQVAPLNAGGMPGAASYYEVKFTDTTKPNGQIWAAAVGTFTERVGRQAPQNDRWFVVWLGNANNPIDTGAAKALAESIRPYAPPPPPEGAAAPEGAPAAEAGAPAAGAPQPGAPGQAVAPGQAPVGVPVPVTNAPPGMVPPG
jgi:hypothetical protein